VLLQLHRASADDPALAKELRLVSMSFDPANDTFERMAGYAMLAASRTNAAPWHFVTTKSQSELQPILKAYGQTVDKKQNPLDPTGPLNHTLRVFLVDAMGNIRNIYSSSTLDPRLVSPTCARCRSAQSSATSHALTRRRQIGPAWVPENLPP
jgi:cytochrome oxidase Cu insertion factor (SCO1/SenC/PrrC family)